MDLGSNMTDKDTSWEKDANLVLHRLDSIDNELVDMNSRLRHIEKNVWVLQAKSAVIGGMAGLAVTLISLLMKGAG